MKKKFGKFYRFWLIFLVSIFVISPIMAYETVICYFPLGENWQIVYHKQFKDESIIQFVPQRQNLMQYDEAVVFHSYKWAKKKNIKSNKFLKSLLGQVYLKDKSLKYTVYKNAPYDAIVSWCNEGSPQLESQCELLRVSDGFEGIISMHYISKNKKYYKQTFDRWYDIISKVKIYNSYYRWDRVLNKADTFEL